MWIVHFVHIFLWEFNYVVLNKIQTEKWKLNIEHNRDIEIAFFRPMKHVPIHDVTRTLTNTYEYYWKIHIEKWSGLAKWTHSWDFNVPTTRTIGSFFGTPRKAPDFRTRSSHVRVLLRVPCREGPLARRERGVGRHRGQASAHRRTRRVVANFWQNFGKMLLVFGCIVTDFCK